MINWTVHIVVLFILSFLLFRVLKIALPIWVYWLAWTMKLTAGIILGLIFFNYYGSGDTIGFFEQALNMEGMPKDQPRTQFFVQLISPLVWLSGGSYWITSLYLSFVSFVGTWYAVSIFSHLFPTSKHIITISFLFVPSIVFWSSGIIKDSLTFGALATVVALSIKGYKNAGLKPMEFVYMLISGFILFKIKHYLFITSLIFSGILFSAAGFDKLPNVWKLPTTIVILTITLMSTQFVHPYLAIDRIPQTLYETNQAILKKSDPEDRLDIEIRSNQWSEILKLIPKAIHAGIFRPSLLDHTPVWGWFHRIENFILTSLLILSILIYVKKPPQIDRPLLLASVLCIILLAAMLPLSTPNFGTLVRYKNAYLPYLFTLVSLLPYRYFTYSEID